MNVNTLLFFYLILQSVKSQPPPGHGKPLGQHNDLKTPAFEEDYTKISSKYLYDNYISTRTPVILRGLSKTFPAFSKWTDEYLVDNHGDLEIRLEAKTEKEHYTPVGDAGYGRASISEFFRRYKTDNMYCVSEIPAPMYQDLYLPALLNCGTMKTALAEMNMWINSGGAKSIIHKDAHNTLNCLLAGSKDWIFINNSHNDGIYQAEEIDGDQGGFSLIDPEAVNYETFPKFATVPWEHATVHAGDCLYLPPRYYHRVKSVDRNFAVSFLFGTSTEFDMEGCDEPTEPLPLDEAEIEWKYPGYGHFSMGNTAPRLLKEVFIEIFLEMTDGDEDGSLKMKDYIDEILTWEADIPYIADKFTELFINKKLFGDSEEITLNFLNEVTLEDWTDIATAQSYDPSNDPYNEHYHILGEDVVGVLKNEAYYDPINLETFLKAYRKLNGSGRVGRELFERLSKGGETVSWYDVDGNPELFEVYGKQHDRGDEEMHLRNDAVKEQAEKDMLKTRVATEKSEL